MSLEPFPLAAWKMQGKTIRQLIAELQSFDNQDLKVFISVDDGASLKPISIVERAEGHCALVHCPQ